MKKNILRIVPVVILMGLSSCENKPEKKFKTYYPSSKDTFYFEDSLKAKEYQRLFNKTYALEKRIDNLFNYADSCERISLKREEFRERMAQRMDSLNSAYVEKYNKFKLDPINGEKRIDSTYLMFQKDLEKIKNEWNKKDYIEKP